MIYTLRQMQILAGSTEEEGWDSGGEVGRRRKRRMKRGGEVEEAKVAVR